MSTPAQSHLNYRGDVVASLPIGLPMGPTTYGSLMYVIGAVYDPATDRTRVAMSAVNPAKAAR